MFGNIRAAGQLSYAHLTGTLDDPSVFGDHPHTLVASSVVVGGLIGTQYDRLWADLGLGLRYTWLTDRQAAASIGSAAALAVVVEGGVDIASFGPHHVAALLRLDSELGGAGSFAALGIGAAYRY